jgi:transmembrane sensor
MNTGQDARAEEARDWAIRLRDPAFADWDGFTAWLEADAANNAAYEAALDEIDRVDALFDVPPPVPMPVRVTGVARAPRRWRAPAIAASTALLAVGGSWLALRPEPVRDYVTAPGERREIALDDGSRILLNGGTRLRMDPAEPRAVAMEQGEALFRIRHDARRPFVVTMADGTRLVDVGTTFNVEGHGGALDVAVSEGAVDYRGTGAAVRLNAGEMLARASANETPVKRAIDPAVVGGWQNGDLAFDEAALADVAADLSRNLGATVAVDPALATRRFSGTIVLDGPAEAMMPRIAPVLNVRIVRDGDGWRIVPPDAARR